MGRDLSDPARRLVRVPSVPAVFVGRDQALERVRTTLVTVPVAVIYGVAGVGKSTLAFALAADWPGPVVYHRALPDPPLATLLDDVRRLLAGGPAAGPADDRERLVDLAERLDASGTLFILDDLHTLAAESQTTLVGDLGRLLRRGRLVATSRERVAHRTPEVDRLDLRLDDLDEASARALWASLDELYGVREQFERGWACARGNPFLLRRVHAGDFDESNPIAATVRGLDDDQRLLAGALAIAQVSLSTAALEGLLPPERARQALASLVTRMVVELDRTGVMVHDLFRDVVSSTLSPDERHRLHVHLAEALRHTELDTVVRGREIVRHLCAVEHYTQAGAFLLEHGREFIHDGAANDLLRAFDAIPLEHRSLEVQAARARTLARALNVGMAHEELRRLAALSPTAPEVQLSFVHAAMLVAEIEGALGTAARLVEEPRLTPTQRMRAQTTYAMMLEHLGRGDQARAILAAGEGACTVEAHRGHLALTAAFTLWLEERDEEAEAMLARAGHIYGADSEAYQRTALFPPLSAAVMARRGHHQEAERLFKGVEAALTRRNQDSLLLADLQCLGANIMYERGERLAALEAFRRWERRLQQSGYVLGVLYARVWIGRLLFILGRRRDATALLDATYELARARGLKGIHDWIRRARAHDPLRQIAARDDQPAATCRERRMQALRAAAGGDGRAMEALLRRSENEVSRPGYAVDRMLGHLARAVAASVRGDAALAASEEACAEELGEAEGVDEDLPRLLMDALGQLRIVTCETNRLATAPPDLSEFRWVLDERTHELRHPRGVVSFGGRPALRRLLYALIERRELDKAELATELWGNYRAGTHDNALWMNMMRLRRLLAPMGLVVQSSDRGYRVVLPPEFVFVRVHG